MKSFKYSMKSQPNGSVDAYCDANNFLTIFEEVDFVKLIGVKHYSKSVLQKRKTQSNLDDKQNCFFQCNNCRGSTILPWKSILLTKYIIIMIESRPCHSKKYSSTTIFFLYLKETNLFFTLHYDLFLHTDYCIARLNEE